MNARESPIHMCTAGAESQEKGNSPKSSPNTDEQERQHRKFWQDLCCTTLGMGFSLRKQEGKWGMPQVLKGGKRWDKHNLQSEIQIQTQVLLPGRGVKFWNTYKTIVL